MVTGNLLRGQNHSIVGGLAKSGDPASAQAEILLEPLGTLCNRQTVLGLYAAINRIGSNQLRGPLGDAKISPAVRTLGPLAGIRVLGPTAATTLASYCNRHFITRKSAHALED